NNGFSTLHNIFYNVFHYEELRGHSCFQDYPNMSNIQLCDTVTRHLESWIL
ncbi:hypothetical protein TSAR_008801, partial [Trichomalopsis sarcophagae]